MTNVTVSIVDGTQKENVDWVTIDNVRWGDNGAAFGTTKTVTAGNQNLTVHKTTAQHTIGPQQVAIAGDAMIVNITVNDATIIVQTA